MTDRRAGSFAMHTPGAGRSWHIVEDGRALCGDPLPAGRTEYWTTGEMPEFKVCIECVGVADGIEVLTQDECDAIGADGRDGRGTITVANITAAEATRLIDFRAGRRYCTAGEHMIETDAPAIVVEEGGSIPDQLVCVACLTALEASYPARAEELRDLAEIGQGHPCVEFGEVVTDLLPSPVVICSLCRSVLQDVPVQSATVR